MDVNAGTIVVGVDGSASSLRALAWAAEQAQAERRSLTLVHAINAVTSAYMDTAVLYPREVRESLTAEGREVLGAAREEVARRSHGVEVHEVFRLADPREVLLELSQQAAMLVLGSRGRGTLRRLLLGSVSVAVARHAGCPVVVHRPGKQGVVRHGVLVGADGTEDSLPVLEFAYKQAALRDLPLTVLHCFWDVGTESLGGYIIPSDITVDLEDEQALLAQSMAGMAERYPEVTVRADISRGQTDQVLLHMAEEMDLVVLGAHESGMVERLLFGSVSVSVLEHATVPVAVVPLFKPRS